MYGMDTSTQCHVNTPASHVVHAPDNEIGASGAAALAECLQKMTHVETLNLSSEFCMVDIVYELAVMRVESTTLLAGVHTEK